MDIKKYGFFDDKTAKFPLPKFRYFPIHDLESLWWIAAHFIIARAVTHNDPSVPEASCDNDNDLDATYRLKHMKFARETFGVKGARMMMLRAGLWFFSMLDLPHPAVRDAGDMLQEARLALVDAYRAVENDLHKMEFHSSADGVYEMLRDCFVAIAEKFKDANFWMEPVRYM